MKVYKSLSELPEEVRPVVTIGTFDGVHKGHQRLLGQLQELAKGSQTQSLLVTFDPHPRSVLQPEAELRMLNTLEEKLRLLAYYGTDSVLVVPFTQAFAALTAEAYVRDFLLGGIHPGTLVIGYDHRFGRDRSGGIDLLHRMVASGSAGAQPAIREIDPQEIDEVAISSTRIRMALSEGQVERAQELLGLPYFLEGIVAEGEKIGRELGYPTANLEQIDPHKLIPGDGIYTVIAETGGKRYGGMMSIGYRPTFGGNRRSLEVHCFGLNSSLYGEKLRVHFLAYLRPEARFPDREALIQAMHSDRERSIAVLEEWGTPDQVILAP